MRKENTYRDKERIIEYIFMTYRKLKLENGQNDMVEYIDQHIDRLSSEAKRMMIIEYVQNDGSYWWEEYYSRATFYRRKKKFTLAFIDCLFESSMV